MLTPLLPGMYNDFGITMSAKYMTQGGKLLGKFLKIIDLTIENHDYAAVFIEKRLLSARDIHDRKATMTETHAGLGI